MAQRSDKTELLAPAGSIEALKLAVNAGADAVYFGVGDFHARRAASGIEISEAVEYCHLFGAKAYLTLNISLKSDEFTAVSDVIQNAFRAKIDAFIVTDLGILPLLDKYAPGVPLHASTQLGVASKEGAQLLKSLGFSRVVLAREAGIEEIRAVKSLGLEVEYFVHGALCVAFSGSCYLSSVKSGESGNRGLCKQPCRLPYRMKIGNSERGVAYYLSPKDQCLIARLKELEDAGVDSFKIEGRLKRDAYAGGVTEVYRKAMDGKDCGAEEISVLKRLFNRGEFSEGYEFEQNREMMYPKLQSHVGEHVALINSVRNGKAYFRTDKRLVREDGFKVLRGGKEAQVVFGAMEKEKDGYSFQAQGVKVGDEIRITNDSELNARILSMQSKLPVTIRFFAKIGKPLRIEMESQGVSAVFEGAITEAAQTAVTSREEIQTSLNKLGNTVFRATEILVDCDEAFVPISKRNELRRIACADLKEKIFKKNLPKYQKRSGFVFPAKPKLKGIFSEVNSLEKALAVGGGENSFLVYRPTDNREEVVSDFVSRFRKQRQTQKLFLFTPPMILQKDAEIFRRILPYFDGIVANSLCAIKLALETNKLLVLGTNLNITNPSYPFLPIADAYCVSVELNERERREFSDGALYAFGRFPLMYFRHCPKLTAHIGCKDCVKEDKIVLRDGKYDFPLERFSVGDECRFRMLNSVNTDLGTYAKGWNPYLDFGSVSVAEIPKIFQEYASETRQSTGDYTLLHTKRGVL